MTAKQGGKSYACLIVGKFFGGQGCFLAHNHTYKLDKLLDVIRYSRYSIVGLLGREERKRGLSPALAAAQMKRHAECGFLPALLQYVQMLPDRTAPYGIVNAMRWNRSDVSYNSRQLLYRRFCKFYELFRVPICAVPCKLYNEKA